MFYIYKPPFAAPLKPRFFGKKLGKKIRGRSPLGRPLAVCQRRRTTVLLARCVQWVPACAVSGGRPLTHPIDTRASPHADVTAWLGAGVLDCECTVGDCCLFGVLIEGHLEMCSVAFPAKVHCCYQNVIHKAALQGVFDCCNVGV